MYQNRILTVLRMLGLLSGNRRYSLRELMQKFDLTERTTYRYLNTIEESGFVLDRRNGSYLLLTNNTSGKTLQRLVHFTEEEAYLLYNTMGIMESETPVKEGLMKKLITLYDIKALAATKDKFDSEKIKALGEAVRKRRKVMLKTYRSSHSETIADRIVEPFEFLADQSAIWCFDEKDKICKQFRIARMEGVKVLPEAWQNETCHCVPFMDAFRMSAAKPLCRVNAKLTLKAYNLLVEEYPLAAKYVQPQNGYYVLHIPVADFQGIGRFVFGLMEDIEVHDPMRFKNFLQQRIKNIAALTAIGSERVEI